MLDVVGRIARALEVPVTADMEAAYGPAPEDAAETMDGVIVAGAVGLNLEDGQGEGLTETSLQVERISAAREAADRAGVPVVINARTDVYLRNIGAPETRFEHAVQRANAYRRAGADCLFVPGVADAGTIGALAKAVSGPINILAGPSTPPARELERLGVARVSVGGSASRAALAVVKRIAEELRGPGTFTFAQVALPHTELNGFFPPPQT
jgi:2-methylisocitrate lyase-like PEP mutase family enzyme